jgi:hypothetical protein
VDCRCGGFERRYDMHADSNVARGLSEQDIKECLTANGASLNYVTSAVPAAAAVVSAACWQLLRTMRQW